MERKAGTKIIQK